MDEIKPKRKYTRRAKPTMSEVENTMPPVEPTEPVVETAPVVDIVDIAIVTAEATDAAAMTTTETTVTLEDGPGAVNTETTDGLADVSHLDGQRSCGKCGRDESPSIMLSVVTTHVGVEKLCNTCISDREIESRKI